MSALFRMRTALAIAVSSLAACVQALEPQREPTPAVSAVSAADLALPVYSLQDITVVATSSARALFDTPYGVETLYPDDVHLRLQPRSLPEALRELPGVLMQKTSHGQVSPYLRGVTSQRVLLLVDGVRLNNSYLREGPNEYWGLIDALYFDQLDVLYGPASVLYGSDAIGGVVLASSPHLPRGAADSGLQWAGGEALLRYASAERSLSEHLEGMLTVDDRWSLSLGLSRRDFGDLRSGASQDNTHTAFEEWGANARLAYWFDADHWLIFGYDSYDRDDINRVHRTDAHVDFEDSRSKGSTGDRYRWHDYLRQAAYAGYRLRNGEGLFSEVDLTVSYQYFNEVYTRIRGNDARDYRETWIDTVGAALRLQSVSDWGTWTYGVDWYRDFVDTRGIDYNADGSVKTHRIQGSVADDATYDLVGIYVQNELPLGERVELITGLRYSYARLDADHVNLDGVDGSLAGDYDALTGSIRLLYHAIPDRLQLFAGISQGFRAPNLSDATRDDEFGGGSEAPTADLDPERFTSYEAGLKLRGGHGHLRLVGFYTAIEDRIGRLTNGGVDTKRNLDSGYIYGVELDGEIQIGDALHVFGQVAWQHGREETYRNREISDGESTLPMSRILPLSARAGVHYQPAGSPWWLEAVCEYFDSQDDLAEGEKTDNRFPPGGTPGYVVGHLRGGWAVSDHVNWVVELQNITDERYRIHGSGINEPGRGLVTTLQISF